MSPDILMLSEELRKAMRKIEEDLASGHIKDFGDYKFACGRYRGLIEANGMIAEIARKMEHEDDD